MVLSWRLAFWRVLVWLVLRRDVPRGLNFRAERTSNLAPLRGKVRFLLLRQRARLDAIAPSLTRAGCLATSCGVAGDDAPPRPRPVSLKTHGSPGLTTSPRSTCTRLPVGRSGHTTHKDNQSLTMLLSLSPVEAYEGGGTAFWARQVAAAPTVLPPTFVLAPPAGSALVFGGRAVHAARPITSGERVVLVECSMLQPHGRRYVP